MYVCVGGIIMCVRVGWCTGNVDAHDLLPQPFLPPDSRLIPTREEEQQARDGVSLAFGELTNTNADTRVTGGSSRVCSISHFFSDKVCTTELLGETWFPSWLRITPCLTTSPMRPSELMQIADQALFVSCL